MTTRAHALLRLPDDHPAWRVVGAWVAARQRGDARAIREAWIAEGAWSRVASEVEVVAVLDGAPLRTGANLVIEGWVRSIALDAVVGLQLVLTGETEGGPVTNRLGIARIVAEADGAWRIAELFDDDERRILHNPAFAQFYLPSRPASEQAAAPADPASSAVEEDWVGREELPEEW